MISGKIKNFIFKYNMKGFKFLVLGTVFAKLFGVFRELIIILEYGYSQEINNYFSLIAILSVITFFF